MRMQRSGCSPSFSPERRGVNLPERRGVHLPERRGVYLLPTHRSQWSTPRTCRPCSSWRAPGVSPRAPPFTALTPTLSASVTLNPFPPRLPRTSPHLYPNTPPHIPNDPRLLYPKTPPPTPKTPRSFPNSPLPPLTLTPPPPPSPLLLGEYLAHKTEWGLLRADENTTSFRETASLCSGALKLLAFSNTPRGALFAALDA